MLKRFKAKADLRRMTYTISADYQKRRYTIKAYNEKGYLCAKFRSRPNAGIYGWWTQAKIRKLLCSRACYLVQTYENSKQKIK